MILIGVQVVYFAMLIMKFANYASWITGGFTVLAVIMALFIIWRDDNPAYKMGWVLLICLLPILGTAMYIFFGNKRPSRTLRRRINPVEKQHVKDLEQIEDVGDIIGTRMGQTVNYIAEQGPYPAWSDTKSKYYPVGDKMYVDMLEDLKNAKHTIFLEYFIISAGKMWDGIFEILQQKAAEGLDVRLIYDDLGCMTTKPKHFARKLREAGIKVMAFNTVKPVVSVVYNNRDHRKLLIIDGNIGYSGGINIADEYVNKIVRFGHWKDTGTRLYGQAVWNYTVMFLNMWNAFVPTDVTYDAYRPNVWHPEEFDSDGLIQPYSDSPLDSEALGENVYLEILNQAEEYVYIYTPYLIIDNEMKTAMVLAAKRGVDVRLVTPGIPDKKLVYVLTRSYYSPLIKAGVRIYEYTPGFIHAKSFLCDGRIGVVGTINMDYRSLYLHFECGTLMVGCEALQDLRKDYSDTFSKSREIFIEDCRRTFLGTLFEAVLRVLSPLL